MMPRLHSGRGCFVTLICLAATVAHAAPSQPNTWISSAATGFWQTSNSWSLAVPPSTVNQTGIFITNAVTKTVTINSSTPSANMTINDLTVLAPLGSTNTLQITNVAAATPLRILNGCTISSRGALFMTNSVVRVDGSGKLCIIDGSVTVRSNASLITTNSGTITAVGNTSSGSLTVLGGSLLPSGLYMGVGS